MKLISMTTFVLEQEILLRNNSDYTNAEAIFKCINYANFLKQPLTLGKFVPCDDNGNVLDEPICENQNASQQLMEFAVKSKIFDNAKSKVLFNDFWYFKFNSNIEIVRNSSCKIQVNKFKFQTIQHLIPYNLDLLVSF